MALTIGGKDLGEGHAPFVIAEVGVNHNGDVGLAVKAIRAAAAAGADAVKFQTFRADRLVTAGAAKAKYQQSNDGVGDQFSMLKALELTREDHLVLRTACEEKNVIFLSTPFDDESLDLLVRLGVPAIKIGSGDLDNHPLLTRAYAQGLTLILSTGMSTLTEVSAAVELLGGIGAQRLALLHCVSSYPAPAEAQNVSVIPELAKLFQVPVGFSDHTLGIGAAAAAVALGACIVEKHFTLDRSLPGPDHPLSLEPDEFRQLVAALKASHAAIGSPQKRVQPVEEELRMIARRSAVTTRALAEGDTLSETDLEMKRPAGGVGGADYHRLLGRRLKMSVPEGHQVKWTDLL